MPAMRSCGHKRWTVSSDDFVGPTQIAIILRLIMLGLLFACAVAFFVAPKECLIITKPFAASLILLFTMQLLVLMNETALLSISLKGTIMNTKPRRPVTKLMYLRICLFFLEVAAMIYISVTIYMDNVVIRCTPTAVDMLEVAIALLWTIIIFYAVGFLIFSDPLGCFSNSFLEGFQEGIAAADRPDDTMKRKMHHAKRLRRDKSIHRNRVEAKRASQKIRRCFKLCRVSGGKANAFDDLSRVLFKLFGNVDLVLSDILAAIVLMSREQKKILADNDCIVRPLREYTMEHLSPAMKGENYEYRPPVDLDFTDKKNRVIMLEFLYYMEFYAFSTYGWPQHMYANLCCGLCQLACATCGQCRYRCNNRDVANGDLLNDNACLCGKATIDLHYNQPYSEFVYATYENGICEAPFHVSLDHLKRTVVIAIRGTLSISDLLTDVNSLMTSMNVDRVGLGYVHKGLYETATHIVQVLERRGILEKAFEKNRDYRLVVTGHSLGAGVACILSILLRPSYPDLICYCFSPQACCTSYNLAQYTKKFVYSFVLGDDIVGRINMRSFLYIRKKILLLLKNCKQHKMQVLVHRNLACAGQTTDDHCEAPFDEVIGKTEDIESAFTSVESKMPRWKRAFKRETRREAQEFQMQLNETEVMSTVSAFIPGNVIHLTIKKSRAPGFLRRCFPHHVESVKERAVEDMCAIRISTTALDDHLPENVLKGLRLVANECIYPEYPETLNELYELPVVEDMPGQYSLEHTIENIVKEKEDKGDIEASLSHIILT